MGKFGCIEMASNAFVRITRSNAKNVNLTKENSQKVTNKLTNTLENSHYCMHTSTIVAITFKALTNNERYFIHLPSSCSTGRLCRPPIVTRAGSKSTRLLLKPIEGGYK
jgi:hypothetical protein